MKPRNTLQVLKDELQFLHSGGYRSPLLWRLRLIFEESPTCPKNQQGGCRHANCPLMAFVPDEYLQEPVPCRHIPLNEIGETIDSLYRTGTNEEIEQALRRWLLKTIQQVEESEGRVSNEIAA